MSDTKIFEGNTERDALKKACEQFLVEPRMLTYEIIEQREGMKTRFKNIRPFCKIEVTEVKRSAPPKPKPAAGPDDDGHPEASAEPRRESRPHRERDSRGGRDRGERDSRGGRNRGERDRGPRKPRERAPRDPEVMATSAAQAQEFVEKLIGRMGYEATVKFEENDERVFMQVGCEDPLFDEQGDGRVVDSLQYLANALINWKLNGKQIFIDLEGARQKREAELVEMAVKLAEKVLDNGEAISLEPMNSGDRRFIHQALTETEGITTRSEGTGGFRRIVILPE